MENLPQVILFSLFGGIISLIGGFILMNNKRSADILMRISTPFAAGALLAAVYFELLPEALHQIPADQASLWVLGGMIAFFMLEHYFNWFHHHHEHEHEATPAPLIIAGDTIHNLLDGIAIGAAFLVDVPTGIVATLAVAIHEIPQEIGDFGLLLKYGYQKKKVILVNAISASAAVLGAVATYLIGSSSSLQSGVLLAVTAGVLTYIAASDLIPTIHEETRDKLSHSSAVLLLFGVLTIGLTTTIAHRYIDDHDHGSHDTEHMHTESEHSHN